MKTNTHPGDYERNQPIIPQPVPLCAKCGGFMLHNPVTSIRTCVDCGNMTFVMVMEGLATDEFRANLHPDASPDTFADGLAAAGYGSSGPY